MTIPRPHRPVPLLLVGGESETRQALADYLAAAGARVPPGTTPGPRLAALHAAMSATTPEPAGAVASAIRAEISALLALGPTGGHGAVIADDALPQNLVHWAGLYDEGVVSPALVMLTDPPPTAFGSPEKADAWIAATETILRDAGPLPRRALSGADLAAMAPDALQAMLAGLGLWIAPRVLRAGLGAHSLPIRTPPPVWPEDGTGRRLARHAERLAQVNISA